MTTCGKSVNWWDGEYEGECELPAGHDGDEHFDGISWFDDDGHEITTTSIDRGDGEKITVTVEDAVKMRDDQLLYGNTFVKPHPTIVGRYQRIDPRTVHAAADIAEHRSMTLDEAREAIARQLP